MAVKITGGSSTAGQANVTSDYSLQVAPTRVTADVGMVGLAAESSPSTDTGGRLVRALEANNDARLRVGLEQPIYSRLFTQTVQTSDYQTNVSTHAVSIGGAPSGFVMNSAGSVAVGVSYIQSWASINVRPSAQVYADFVFKYNQVPQTNNVMEWGFRSDTVATTATANGICLRMNAAGELRLVRVQNSIDIATSGIISQTSFQPSTRLHVILGFNNDMIEAWVNGELLATLDVPAAAVYRGHGYVAAMNMYVMCRNTGITSLAQSINLYEWAIYENGMLQSAPPSLLAALGYEAGPNNIVQQGQTAQWSNSAYPANASLSNTTPSHSAIGGYFNFAAVAGAATDYALFRFTNDTNISTATGGGRRLVIKGFRVSMWNTGAVNSATVPTVVNFGFSVGSNQDSLAGTDSVANKSHLRTHIGSIQIPVSAVIGQLGDRELNVALTNEQVVQTGERLNINIRIVSGAATASQVIQGIITPDFYWI